MGNAARALVCIDKNKLTVESVILGEVGDYGVLVRTIYSGVSVGTEFAVISGRLDWGPYPLITGYQGVGVVVKTGSAVTEFTDGDHVYYRDNSRVARADGTAVTSAAGVHCSHALIDVRLTHGLANLPDDVDPRGASLFVLPAVGLHGVDMAGVGTASAVCVLGAGPIGLGVIAAANRRGAKITAVDLSGHRLQLAREFGAQTTHELDATTLSKSELATTLGEFDFVFEATGVQSLVDVAVHLCREGGVFVWQGNYGEGAVCFNFLAAHMKQIRMVFPCNDGLEPSRAAVIRAMADGSFPWGRTVSHVVPAERSPDFYESVRSGKLPDLTAAVVDWGSS